MKNKIIELDVKNHPGVFSQIAGLFARRAFNLEGILCLSIGDKTKSRIMLLVNDDDRIGQIVKQLEKLYDVIEVEVKENDDQNYFNNLDEALTV
jgi:acetolactate synthase-1/3 small subunit